MISLEVQKIDFKMTYINPMDPPDWFKETSPTGQVPLLKVDDTKGVIRSHKLKKNDRDKQ
jgi:glutathione S-transferase